MAIKVVEERKTAPGRAGGSKYAEYAKEIAELDLGTWFHIELDESDASFPTQRTQLMGAFKKLENGLKLHTRKGGEGDEPELWVMVDDEDADEDAEDEEEAEEAEAEEAAPASKPRTRSRAKTAS